MYVFAFRTKKAYHITAFRTALLTRPFSLSFSLPFGLLLETSTDSPAAVFTPPPIFRRAPGVHIQYIVPLTEIPIPPAGNAVCGAGPFRRAFSPGPDGSA